MPEASRPRKLVGLYWRVSAGGCLVFHFKERNWDIFESYRPFSIADALKVGLGRIDEVIPGTLARAAKIDDDNWMKTRSRKRRYIVENRDLLYLDRPRLRNRSEKVGDHFVLTNISWQEVPEVLKVACKAAGIEHGSMYRLPLDKRR
jgi:hypothetical protein